MPIKKENTRKETNILGIFKKEGKIERRIRLYASSLVKECQELTDFEFGYNEESLEWVDRFINQQQAQNHRTSELEMDMMAKIGSFFGECIHKNYGGRWIKFENTWAIEVDSYLMVLPFDKTKKRFRNSEEDGIVSLFRSIPHIPRGKEGV